VEWGGLGQSGLTPDYCIWVVSHQYVCPTINLHTYSNVHTTDTERHAATPPGSLHSPLLGLLGLLTRSLAFTAELALQVDQVLPLFLEYQCICISVSLYLCVAVVMANRRER
jgi:hypothetical protein